MSLTAEQLEMRRNGIGGSEIAAVLGESRFSTPFDVWLAKTQGWVTEETEDMRRGTFLEDGIARWYAQRYGIEPQGMEELSTVRHSTRSVALCTPDRLVWNKTARLLSIKAPRRSEAWGEPGTDQVPPEYLLQLQWEHAICCSRPGLSDLGDEMHLAALVDGDLCVYVTQADRELQSWMLDYAEAWWARHVVGGEQPSMDGSERAKRWLRDRFPQDSGIARSATPEEEALLLHLELAEAEEERAGKERETLANQMRQLMGDASRVSGKRGYATWKTDKRGNKSFRTKWTNKEQS